MGLHHGEVALLIAVIEVGAALGLKGLGDARQTGAGGGRGDLGVSALELVGDGIFHQCVGAPLAVNLQILVDGHIDKVEGLLHAVVQVEPAHKGIAAVGGVCGSRVHQTAVGDRPFGVGAEFGPSLQRGLIQIELHRVDDGHPLGVENHIVGGHSVLGQLKLCSGALGIQIPAAEGHRTGLVGAGHSGSIVLIIAQRGLILHALSFDVLVTVIEGQGVAVAGIVESRTAATATVASTVMIGESFEFIAVLTGNSVAANARNFEQLDCIGTVQVFAVISHRTFIARASTVIIGCTRFRHDSEIVGVGATTATLCGPKGASSIFGYRLILVFDICAPLGGNDLSRLIVTISIVVLKGEGLLCAVVIDIDHA